MTNARLLLSDELVTKVDVAAEAAYVKAEAHYNRTFKRPIIRFDIKNTNGGEAWIKKNLIRLNLILLVENEEHFLAQTVPHEVAHLVAHFVYDAKPMNGKKVRPHGKEWQEVMGVLGIPPNAKHKYDCTSIQPRFKDGDKAPPIPPLERAKKAFGNLDEDDQGYFRDWVDNL